MAATAISLCSENLLWIFVKKSFDRKFAECGTVTRGIDSIQKICRWIPLVWRPCKERSVSDALTDFWAATEILQTPFHSKGKFCL